MQIIAHTEPGSQCRSQHTQNQAFNSAHSAVYSTQNQAFSPNHEAQTHIQRYECTSTHTQRLYLYTHTNTNIVPLYRHTHTHKHHMIWTHTSTHIYSTRNTQTHTHTCAHTHTLPNFQNKHKNNSISWISPLQFGAYVCISSFYNSQLQFAIYTFVLINPLISQMFLCDSSFLT